MARRALPLLALCILVGCVAGAARPAPRPAGTTVWLCRPGAVPDPCIGDLATTVIRADGTTTVEHPRPAARPPIDCFYVYPTVSPEPTGNSDLTIGLAETVVAQIQASRFSQVCRVYAPMYRQITSAGLVTPSLHASPLEAYQDVLAAWRDYLAHDNHGRGVVLVGHSQGAYILKHLVSTVVDRSPAQRRRLVSAILLGGQVLAGNTSPGAGDFTHVPRARRPRRPAASSPTRASQASHRPTHASAGSSARSVHVLCVNPGRPGAPAGATAPITPLFPTAVTQLMGGPLAAAPATPWVAFPGLYRASCRRTGTASWLQIDHRRRAGDRRPVVGDLLGSTWGLHTVDVNIALQQLVALVGSEAHAYTTRR